MRAARSGPGSNSKSSSGVYRSPSERPISRRINPLALRKPAIAAAARALPSICEKNTRPCRRSLRSLINIPETSRSTSSATRSALRTSLTSFFSNRSPLSRRSVVDNLELFLAQRSKPEGVDEVHDLAQRAIHEGAVAANLADAQFRALPHVVTV